MNYMYSVVMPLYNISKYLKESVDSIISQTIGFSNIQLIMVNDGSTDDTLEICENYRKEYPDNIVIVDKKNGGVSSARNTGFDYIKGRYTVFFDGDDTWELNAFENVFTFFERNYDEIDLCSCKLVYFGDYEGFSHPLDYKFGSGDTIVDLKKKPTFVQSTIGNVVFKTEAISNVRFNEHLITGEDSVFNNTVILGKLKIGILNSAVFYYRRNRNKSSLSATSVHSKGWFLDVPKLYYGDLISKSLAYYDCVVPYIQFVILYDMRWRNYSPDYEQVLNDEEKKQYKDCLFDVMQYMDVKSILESKGINAYKRLAFLNMKYGSSFIDDTTLDNAVLKYEGDFVFNLRAASVLKIAAIEYNNDNMVLEGVFNDFGIGKDSSLYVKNSHDDIFTPDFYPRTKNDKFNCWGGIVSKGVGFRVELPLIPHEKYRFVLFFKHREIVMKPGFSLRTTLSRKVKNSFEIAGKYIIKFINKSICVYKNTLKSRTISEYRLKKEIKENKKKLESSNYYSFYNNRNAIKRLKLEKQVCFFSPRDDDRLLPNINSVYSKCNVKKLAVAKRAPYNSSNTEEIVKAIYSSKVVVTDDYNYFFCHFGKKKGQVFIQIWHAAGAFKMFGLDGTSYHPSVEKRYHRDYDLVCVSSEYVRKYYAQAFGISIDKVKALGVPRTDIFFDEDYERNVTNRFFSTYPGFKGKKIIIYAPTFRDVKNQTRAEFTPDLDFDELSNCLPEDMVMLICPHPVMRAPILRNKYDNIHEIRDFSTTEMMFVGDLMITDYSSVIFEYSLLNKPIIFFCYDYDKYDSDFYLDYNNDLPGKVLKTQQELISYLSDKPFEVSEKLGAFREKYMDACDGKSTERITGIIEKML